MPENNNTNNNLNISNNSNNLNNNLSKAVSSVQSANPLGSLSNSSSISPVQDNKKFYIIILISVLVLGIILGGIYFYFKNKSISNNANNNQAINFPNLENNNTLTYEANKFTRGDLSNGSSQGEEGDDHEYNDLLHIWDRPVVGYEYKKEKKIIVLDSNVSSGVATNSEFKLNQKTKEVDANMIYFVDKATGNIYKREIYNGGMGEAVQLSKSIIAYIDRAVFSKSVDFLAIIKNGKLIIDSVPTVSGGSFNESSIIDNGVSRVYAAKDYNQFLYTKIKNNQIKVQDRGSVGSEKGMTEIYKYDISSGKTFKVATIPLTSFSLDFVNKDYAYIYTSPADNMNQSIFKLNLNNGNFINYVASGVDSILSSDYANILYFGGDSLKYKNIKIGQEQNLEATVFASKCLIPTSNKLLDNKILCAISDVIEDISIENWYKGANYFLDSFYTIDLSSGERKQIYNPSIAAKANLDVYNMKLVTSDKVLFKDKLDESLWCLDLNLLLKGE